MLPHIDLHGFHIFRPFSWVLAEGEDAHDFLQSQFSNDIRGLQMGDSCYGLWLDQKGKVHGDSQILRVGDESFFLFSYFTRGEYLIEKLEKFIVADELELEDRSSGIIGVSLHGAAAGCFENFESGVLADLEFHCFPGRRSSQSSLDLVISEEDLDPLLHLIQKDGSLESLDNVAVEALRILSKVPRVPQDIGPDELPQEGGLEKDAVSFNKGCYLGQEVMSRLHSMGKVRRSLQLVESTEPIAYGTDILCGGKKVGVAKTSFEHQGRYVSLALISNMVDDEATLEVERDKNGQLAKRFV